MQLLKGAEVLCDLTKTKENGNVVSIKNQKFCPYQLSNNSVSFYLNNLDSSHGSYYSCSLSIFDPPPFREKILSKEYLHIYESQLCCQLKLWLPIGCAAFAVVYIFGCIFVFWFAKKKYGSSVHDPNSEYMFMAAVNTAKKSKFAGESIKPAFIAIPQSYQCTPLQQVLGSMERGLEVPSTRPPLSHLYLVQQG
ncbi:Inducible T-cell costimulator [Microtus ochrogaster]|uniref:Inducible T-cell costimulator n=1 Tax=Microtus ochrogaster TaxID=79684 RepID=A0A8J6GB60_MICOH|nr:Inducible T-cell costimulator [Microtus ochrogaster]